MKKLVLILAWLASCFSAKSAQAVGSNGNYYYEICVVGAECTLGVVTKYGQLGILIRQGQQIPGLSNLGNVWKVGPSGDLVASISEVAYQFLKSKGLRTYYVSSAGDVEKEMERIDMDIRNGSIDCALATLGCAVGAGGAVASGGWAVGAAMLACLVAKRQCESIARTNLSLRQKKEELKAQLEKTAKEKSEQEGGGESGGGGEGGGASPGPGGEHRPHEGPIPGGTVTVTEPRPGGGGGGGSTGRPPVLH